MSEIEDDKQDMLHEIKYRIIVGDYELADKLCDYYRILYGPLPGETND